MIQIIPQTREEKIAMYLKLTKRELAEMLTSANEHLDRLTRQPEQWQPSVPAPMAPNILWPPNTWTTEKQI